MSEAVGSFGNSEGSERFPGEMIPPNTHSPLPVSPFWGTLPVKNQPCQVPPRPPTQSSTPLWCPLPPPTRGGGTHPHAHSGPTAAPAHARAQQRMRGGHRTVLGNSFCFFLFVKDSRQGPPTANRQPPPTANRHQPPPIANRCSTPFLWSCVLPMSWP